MYQPQHHQQQQHMQYQLQQEYQQQNEMMQHHHQRQDLMQMTENMLTFHNNDGNNQQHPQEVSTGNQIWNTQIYRIERNEEFKLKISTIHNYRTLALALMMISLFRIVTREKITMKCL